MFNDAPCLAVEERGGRFFDGQGTCSLMVPCWGPTAEKPPEFIHYNPAEYLFSSAQATKKGRDPCVSPHLAGRRAGRQAGSADALENFGVFLSCLPQQGKLSKHWNQLLPAPTLHVKEHLFVVLLAVT